MVYKFRRYVIPDKHGAGRKPYRIAAIERLFRKLKREEVDLRAFESCEAAADRSPLHGEFDNRQTPNSRKWVTVIRQT